MTITAPQTVKGSTSAGLSSISYTPSNVGDLLIVTALATNTTAQTVQPTNITDNHGVITWIKVGAQLRATATPPNGWGAGVWIGIVPTGGAIATTISATWSSSVTSPSHQCEMTVLSLHNSVAGQTWAIDGVFTTNASTATTTSTVTMPTVGTTNTGECYFGYGSVSNTASTTGQTAGYTAFSTATNGNLVLYGLNLASSGSQSPIAKQSANGAYAMFAFTIMALTPTITVTLASPTVTATAFALTRNKTLPMSVAQMVNIVAYQLAVLKKLVLGSPSVTATAYAMTVSKGPVAITVVLASPALAASAYAMSWVHTYPPLPSLTVAASAHPLGVSKSRTLDHPVVASQAYPMTLAKLKTLTSPTVAATAYAMTVYKSVVLASPTMVATAYIMHPSSPNNVHLDSPTCHATAYPMGVNKRYPPFLMHWWFHARGQHVPHWSEEQEKS